MTPREAQTWLGQLLESMGFDASVSIIELDGQPALELS